MNRQTYLIHWMTVAAMTLSFCGASVARAALVNHWDFEEPDGQSPPQVLDSAGGNHGTFQNMDDSNRSSDTADIPNPPGSDRSLSFNGTDEAVILDSRISLPSAADWSATLWYRGTETGTTTGGGDIFGRTLLGTDDSGLFALLAIIDSKVEFIWYDNTVASYQHNIRSTTSVDDDLWHHIAIVQHASQTMDLYIDGVLEASGPMTIATDFWIDYMMRGFDGLSGQQVYTSGKLDEIRLYDEALSAREVLFLTPEPTSMSVLAVMVLTVIHRRRRPIDWCKPTR